MANRSNSLKKDLQKSSGQSKCPPGLDYRLKYFGEIIIKSLYMKTGIGMFPFIQQP